jgi:hypothetical protein
MPPQIPIRKRFATHSTPPRRFFYVGKRFFAATQPSPRALLHRFKNNPRKYGHRVFLEAFTGS